MKIIDIICSQGKTGFYFDDQRAIKNGAKSDGFTYIGDVITRGFTSIRQSGESISVMIILEDKQIAYGDCAAVQYSGAGGRDPVFLAKDFIPVIEKEVKPRLVGREANNFKELCSVVENIRVEGKKLHTAIRYGVTQAILDAVSKSNHCLMCQVIAKEYNTKVLNEIVPIFTQSGDSRYENADKMIIKEAQVLPHGLINNVEDKLGYEGEKLEEYVDWLRNRIIKLRRDKSYNPVIHIDVYGTLGVAFGNENYKKIADYMGHLGEVAKPFKLRIEGPVDMEEREKQEIKIRDYGIDRILKEIPYCRLNGHREQRLPNNINISYQFIEGESLLIMLDMAGICGSSGSACTSGSLDPSHVLLAIGLPHEIAHGSLRLTISHETTKEDMDYVIDNLKEIVQKLRAMSPLYEDFIKAN